MLEPGSVVGGKLRIERIIGQGGMGIVAIATHLELDQLVAVKVVHDDIAAQPEVVERFIREARASARLRSEHACKVSDVGRLDSGAPYLVMELLEGYDLGAVIEAAHLAPQIAADYVIQACVAIAEAHALGIVHRDLKPKNLFVTQRLDDTPLIKVLDFGIAKAPTPADSQLTKTTTVIGSPGYMSPEQLRSARDVDARSDIWSLGVILYECIAGTLPFQSDTLMELAVKISMDQPMPLGAEVDARYAAITMKCLEKPPANRYANVADLANDLAQVAGPSSFPTRDLVTKLLFARGSTAGQSSPILPMGEVTPGTQVTMGVGGAPLGASLGSASGQRMMPSAASFATGATGLAPSSSSAGTAPAMPPGAGLTPVPLPISAQVTVVPGPPGAPENTTLGAAAGTSGVVAHPPPRKRKIGLIVVIAGIAMAAGGAGVFFAMRGGTGTRHGGRQGPHDAGAVVAVADGSAVKPGIDAAVIVETTPDAPVTPVAVDAAVAAIDGGSAAADATVVALLTDARAADAAVARTDAAVAHADAAVAHTDAAVAHADAPITLFADAGTGGEPRTAQGAVIAARGALNEGNPTRALHDAELALRLDPNVQGAHQVAARAACELGNEEAARRHARHVGKRAFRQIRATCKGHGIDLGEDSGGGEDD